MDKLQENIYDFSKKIVLISASSKGIGFGIANAFHTYGAKVVINGRDSDSLLQAKSRLSEIDSERVLAIKGDIGQYDFIKKMIEKTEKHFNSSVDILINNSGGPPPGSALSMSEHDWESAININMRSVIRLTNLVVPGMKKKKWGRVINLTSTLAKEPGLNMILSNVTRSAVASFSKSMANELGEYGITVNTILTGGCLTERFIDLAKKSIEGTNESLKDAIKRMEDSVPVKFISTPEDFAETVIFLASERANYINGTSIPLDGGTSKSIF